VRKIFVSITILLALASASMAQTASQSCPNQVSFGVHPTFAVDKSVQAEIEVTYFTTDDPNVFISERAGINRSASSMTLETNEFVTKLKKLENDGLAKIQKQERTASYLGETAELRLEHDSVKVNERMIQASAASTSTNYVYGLDRLTEVNVHKGSSDDGDFYRVMVLSWFVNATAMKGGQKVVDYDASRLLAPGQTMLIKLMSDDEIKRSGRARSHVAVTMRSVSTVGSGLAKKSRNER
jgi:hypothetical protein